jgi:hypothetical protein
MGLNFDTQDEQNKHGAILSFDFVIAKKEYYYTKCLYAVFRNLNKNSLNN